MSKRMFEAAWSEFSRRAAEQVRVEHGDPEAGVRYWAPGRKVLHDVADGSIDGAEPKHGEFLSGWNCPGGSGAQLVLGINAVDDFVQERRDGKSRAGIRAVWAASLHPRLRSRSYSCLDWAQEDPSAPFRG